MMDSKKVWTLLKETIVRFIDDDALSRGAAIAFFAVTSLAPILLIVVAIVGLAFDRATAQNALVGQFQSLMGQESADLVRTAIQKSNQAFSGTWATFIGIVTLLVTSSGVFVEIQSALNGIWKVTPRGSSLSRIARARIASLGLVAALGFLLLVSLVVSAGLQAFGHYANNVIPIGKLVLTVVSGTISFLLIAALFAAIYKVLPDIDLEWRDVIVGGCATSLLFSLGKFLIGKYLGSTAVSSTYGAAGALIVVLLWIYYTSEIFLLGAEFTHAYATHHGSQMASRPSTHTAQPRPSQKDTSAETPLLAYGIVALALLRRLRASRRQRSSVS